VEQNIINHVVPWFLQCEDDGAEPGSSQGIQPVPEPGSSQGIQPVLEPGSTPASPIPARAKKKARRK